MFYQRNLGLDFTRKACLSQKLPFKFCKILRTVFPENASSQLLLIFLVIKGLKLQINWFLSNSTFVNNAGNYFTVQKMKFFIKDFFNKCDQIRKFLRITLHLLKKSLIENFIFRGVLILNFEFILKYFQDITRIFLLTFRKHCAKK